MNDFFLFRPKSPNFYQKSVNSLLVDCFLTPKIFIIFVRHEYGLKMLFLVIPYNSFVRIEDTALKWSLIVHVGCINENNGQNWILGYLKYMIMYVNMQYEFAYL